MSGYRRYVPRVGRPYWAPTRGPTAYRRRRRRANIKYGISRMRDMITAAKQARFDEGSNIMRTDAAVADDNLTYLIRDITEIARGDFIDSREGGAISIKGIAINVMGANAAANARAVRVLIVNPLDNLYPSANLAGLFSDEAYSLAGLPFNKFSQSINNPVNKQNFRVLFDKVLRIDNNAQANGGLARKFYVNLRRKGGYKVLYPQDASSNVAVQGRLFMIAMLCEYDDSGSAFTALVRTLTTVYFRDAHWSFAGRKL